MKTVVFVLLPTLFLHGSCKLIELDMRWEQFKAKNNRNFNTEGEKYRREIWEATIEFIKRHNTEAAKGIHTFTLQETPLDDLTVAELQLYDLEGEDFDFNQIINRTGENIQSASTGGCLKGEWRDSNPYDNSSSLSLPKSIDWVAKGYVTSVKNQGQCRSCWAFAAVGATEGQVRKTSGALRSLSAQCLVDCVYPNRQGCKGGSTTKAFRYVEKNGIATEKSYPYKAKAQDCSMTDSLRINETVTGYKTINTGEELLNAVANVGPVSVRMRTDNPKGERYFRNYKRGIFDKCLAQKYNHAVLVVGYGVQNKTKFWKIKNSWGTKWGQDGYFLLTREVDNPCGIYGAGSFPIVSKTMLSEAEGSRSSSTTADILLVIVLYGILNIHIHTACILSILLKL